ncbi:heterochromatin protein 1-binding protein 3 isoform X2 [Gadus morhua]|uniref:heterochromatin protein 1-binding protein 3 isoform X2 n=1 Tax=Gadus morhua TaxID=8049 RepID=UPI0011B76AF3|nr:heterochromatin protein 1-binding protein 3 isoform X2 [Gadus morhua]
MPIRRAAATPPQDRAASPAPEEGEEAHAEPSEDSPPVMEDEGGAPDCPLPAEEGGEVGASSQTNGEELGSGDVKAELEAENEGHARPTLANGDSLKCQDCAEGQCATHCFVLLKRIKDGGKLGKAKVKKMKKTIPPWASISANKKMAAAVSGFARATPKVDEVLLEAVKSGSERTGMSYMSILKYVTKNYPSLELDKRKFLIKKALKKHLEKGSIKQLKGKGFAGSFAAQKQPANKSSAAAVLKSEPLGDALPLIITRLCEPKEASYILIKKYLEQHFPQLHIDNRPDLLKSALVRAVDKGHLERITGKGASGTFQLKRTGDKVLLAGGALEDAISAAIIAMNEPKTCSTTTLRKYLCHANEDSTETRIVALLRKTLTKCKMLGWMDQITGTGLNGTYRLAFPYYPSPAVLFPDRVIAPPKKKKTPQRTSDTSEEESESEESEEEEEESDDEPPTPPKRKAGKRPAPKTRRPPPSKKPRSASQSKARGRRAPPIKKQVTPAKKAPPPAKKPAAASKKAAPAKATPPPKATPTAKATPLKRAAPAKRPKTPAVKKLSARGSRAAPRKATPQKATPQKATPRKATPQKATPRKATPQKAPARKEAKAPPPGRQSLRSKK